MINYDELPIFPLNTVLYPEMPLPLHIFEPRYVEMIEGCRAHHARFGVVLIRAGEEVGGVAHPFSVGTTARVRRCETLPDGRRNVLVTGESRFRILEAFQNKSFMTARTERIVDDPSETASLQEAQQSASVAFRSYLTTLMSAANRHVSSLQIPSDPIGLSYAVAIALQIPLTEKQLLLECPSAEERLRREIEILHQEIDAYELLRDTRAASPGRGRNVVLITDDVARKLITRN